MCVYVFVICMSNVCLCVCNMYVECVSMCFYYVCRVCVYVFVTCVYVSIFVLCVVLWCVCMRTLSVFRANPYALFKWKQSYIWKSTVRDLSVLCKGNGYQTYVIKRRHSIHNGSRKPDLRFNKKIITRQ